MFVTMFDPCLLPLSLSFEVSAVSLTEIGTAGVVGDAVGPRAAPTLRLKPFHARQLSPCAPHGPGHFVCHPFFPPKKSCKVGTCCHPSGRRVGT